MSFSAASALFARNSQLVAVAQDNSIGFYSGTTLRKTRVERLGDFRIVGLTIQGSTLHALDSARNYYSYNLATFAVDATFRIELANASAAPPQQEEVAASIEGDAARPVVLTGRARRVQAAAAAAAAQGEEGLEAMEAHFHFAPQDTKDGRFRQGDLCAAILTKSGVVHARIGGAAEGRLLLAFPPGLASSASYLAVGRRTGLVAVSQRGQKWLWTCDAFSAATATGPVTPKTTTLGIAVSCIACQPDGPAIAIGGDRGELDYFPDISAGTAGHFSDHWHHTPMAAIAFSVDGMMLYTGAAESVVLCWNLHNFSHRKLGCSLGTIFSITAADETPGHLLLSCGESTLANADLRQHRVSQSVEGVHWSPSHPCTGLVVLPWMGQRCVALTGLPDVVRICDPVSQQAVHALHISYQMETIVRPPTVGITHVAVLDEGRTVLTYEACEAFALPAALRWWKYDPASRKHIEQQCIYSPHRSEITAMVADDANKRFFTLSADSVKCWSEATPTAGSSAVFETAKQWRNAGAIAAPSFECSRMALSADGTVLFVADDSVHAFYVESVQPGATWPLIRTFHQTATTTPMSRLVLVSAANCVAACSGAHVFAWSLISAEDAPRVTTLAGRVAGLTAHTDATVLAATADGSLSEIAVASGSIVGTASTHKGVTHLETLRVGGGRVAMVIEGSGLHVVNVHCAPTQAAGADPAAAAAPIDVNEELAAAAAGSSSGADAAPLAAYFRVREAAAAGTLGGGEQLRDTREHALAVASTRRWLNAVVGSEAYGAPPVSSMFSAFLDVIAGDSN